MIKKETFVKLFQILEEVEERTDKFNKDLEDVFNAPYRAGEYGGDTRMMCYWMEDPVREIIKNILVNEMGETNEGADWAVMEMPGQIKFGSTCIEDYEISSYEDYYDYLTKNFQNLKKASGELIREYPKSFVCLDEILKGESNA